MGGRRWARAACLAVATAVATAALPGTLPAALAAGTAPRILAVEPARTDSLLVCRLLTAGLPGDEIMSTLHSGLPSAVDLQLLVLDAAGRALAGANLRLQLAFDLWEEHYTVTHGDGAARLEGDQALRAWLAATPWLPVAPLAALAGSGPLRLSAALRLHVIAPSAREQMGKVVAAPGGEEISVGLGRLIRFFYQAGRRERGAGTALSSAFTAAELAHAQD